MQAQSEIGLLIEQLLARGGNDLYFIAGARPAMRLSGAFTPMDETPLSAEAVNAAIRALLPEADVAAFAANLEFNTAIDWGNEARLRVNLFMQRQKPGIVLRRIAMRVPTLEEMKLPPVYGQIAMENRGLVLIAGAPHAGKSSTLAAMIHHRNIHGHGHIVTVENPAEFIHMSKGCILTQRDVGIDTRSVADALENASRQSADVIAVGDLRPAAEQALALAETGHLVLATLQAGDTTQAIEQLLLCFPEEARQNVLARLSQSLRAVLAQRLVAAPRHKLVPAVEILLNEGLVRNLLREGKLRELKACIEKGTDVGMQTFDQALIALCLSGEVTEDAALAASDNASSLRIQLKQLGMERKIAPKSQF